VFVQVLFLVAAPAERDEVARVEREVPVLDREGSHRDLMMNRDEPAPPALLAPQLVQVQFLRDVLFDAELLEVGIPDALAVVILQEAFHLVAIETGGVEGLVLEQLAADPAEAPPALVVDVEIGREQLSIPLDRDQDVPAEVGLVMLAPRIRRAQVCRE
jgi:hypothetical protein